MFWSLGGIACLVGNLHLEPIWSSHPAKTEEGHANILSPEHPTYLQNKMLGFRSVDRTCVQGSGFGGVKV